jgi:glucose/mannose-6-phosphate isomerase
MNLDDLDLFKTLDRSHMLEQINGLPDQLEAAFKLGMDLPVAHISEIRQVLAVGWGEMIAGADCLSAYVEPILPIPLVIWRENYLPGWAKGVHTLVLILTNLRETETAHNLILAAFESGCQVVYLGDDGRATELARMRGGTAWTLPVQSGACTTIADIFGLVYCLFERLGLLPEPGEDLQETLAAIRLSQTSLLPSVPVVRNPAKRLAGQFYGRWVMLFASEYLAPVARRWKNQLNRMAKSGGQFEFIPEADYNTLAGLDHPVSIQKSIFTLFLRGDYLHPQNMQRIDLTREMCLQQGLNTDFVNARGNSRMAQLWTALLFGDYTAYYLAMAHGVDPASVEILDVLLDGIDHENE